MRKFLVPGSQPRLARLAAPSLAQTRCGSYPSRAVKIIVSAPPGGGVDIVARVIADRLAKMWGQPFVVENRPGAGGNLGAEAVAQAEPDGYTILAAQPAPLTTNVVHVQEAQLRSGRVRAAGDHDLDPEHAGGAAGFPGRIRWPELIAYAKANPGKVNFGSQGVGTTPHLTGELFARVTGTKLTHVPYRGTAQAVNDLIAGHVDLLFFQIDSVREQYQAKKAKMLAVTTAQRVDSVPEVPTIGEAGVTGFRSDTWNALAAPPKTPAAIVAKLNPGINEVLKAPETVRASAPHEHDAGRRHARRDQEVHQGRDRALGRGDPRGQDQRGVVFERHPPPDSRTTVGFVLPKCLTGRVVRQMSYRLGLFCQNVLPVGFVRPKCALRPCDAEQSMPAIRGGGSAVWIRCHNFNSASRAR